jgi:hypothetical protein
MELLMEYRDDDRRLFNLVDEPNRVEGWSMVGWLVCLICLAVVLGCDSSAQDLEIKQTAVEKKADLMGMPCTWVAQCGYPISDCPVTNRKCVRAE